jgi:hypothetical protein
MMAKWREKGLTEEALLTQISRRFIHRGDCFQHVWSTQAYQVRAQAPQVQGDHGFAERKRVRELLTQTRELLKQMEVD